MGKYALVVALLVGLSDSAFARDDGRYADNPLSYWFDNRGMQNKFRALTEDPAGTSL